MRPDTVKEQVKSSAGPEHYFQMGWPILSLIALIGVAVSLLFADVARDQDRTYERTTRNFVKQASENWVSTNAAISNEYALWSDAYVNTTLSYDEDWLADNFVSETISSISIISPTNGLRFTYLSEDTQAERAAHEQFLKSIDLSRHGAYQGAPSKDTLVISPSGLVEFDGRLAVVSAQPVRPDANFDGPRPTPTMPIHVAVAIKVIDTTAIEKMGASYGLTGVQLHLGEPPKAASSHRIVYELKGIDGQTLAWIDWDNLRPGTKAFSKRIGSILIGLVLLGLLTLAVTQRLLSTQIQLSEAARQSAEEASKTKSTFLANVSHELRTPLNAIIGYSELVKEDCEDIGANQSARDMAKVIGSAHHLLGLINDLLDHSKIEAGKMDLNPSVVPLKPLFEGVGEALAGHISKNQSRFVLNCDPMIGDALIDGMRLKQCLLNLVSNAAKFTHDGTITLSARPVVIEAKPFIYMSVKDTGVGMSEATLAKLFAPFVQADASTAANFGGTGLGLVITRALVEAMGGTIKVESVVGQGSMFTILVPRGMAEAMPTRELEKVA